MMETTFVTDVTIRFKTKGLPVTPSMVQVAIELQKEKFQNHSVFQDIGLVKVELVQIGNLLPAQDVESEG